MNTQIFNYRSGQQVIPERIRESVIYSIKSINYRIERYDIRNFNKDFISKLKLYGWSDSLPLSVYSKISITSIFDKIGLCIQTGNYARIYADMLKLQTLYTDEKINAAIIVIPTKECADAFGKNVANYERLIRELTYIFSRVITVPLLIISFNSE